MTKGEKGKPNQEIDFPRERCSNELSFAITPSFPFPDKERDATVKDIQHVG